LSRAENYIVSNGIRMSIDRTRGLRGGRIKVQAHLAEVLAEARLHSRTRCRIQRLAGCVQRFVNNVRHFIGRVVVTGLALDLLFLRSTNSCC
jgi:hypothetical protein